MPFTLTFPPSSTVTLRMARVLRVVIETDDSTITVKSMESSIDLSK